MPMTDPGKIKKIVEAELSAPEYRKKALSFLEKLCTIDTSPNPDPSVMKAGEDRAFCEIRRELEPLGGNGRFVPINPDIQRYPAFSKPHFTRMPQRPEGLTFEKVYKDRHNYLYAFEPSSNSADRVGRKIAVNSHIDVAAPFFPPRIESGRILSGGARGGKAFCVAMVEAAKILDKLVKEGLVRLNRKITMMFVIAGESGGNGSLSLALDRKLRDDYDSILIGEAVGRHICPAGIGELWYRTEIDVAPEHQLAAASWIVLSLEAAARKIKEESDHPLFPNKPVRTCHGIIGHFGEDPSRICGRVVVNIGSSKNASEIERIVNDAVAEYVAICGDKTKIYEKATGNPRLERHFVLKEDRPGSFSLEILGSPGNMGSGLDNDCAITKMAYAVRRLLESSSRMDLRLAGGNGKSATIVLEGGQSFLPTHRIEDVITRLCTAASIGLANYAEVFGAPGAKCRTIFDKLHNAAFDGDPKSPSMLNAIRAMEICSPLDSCGSVQGLGVSCDARLFACEYPDIPVIAIGPVSPESPNPELEELDIQELCDTIRFLVFYMLIETGSAEL